MREPNTEACYTSGMDEKTERLINKGLTIGMYTFLGIALVAFVLRFFV